MCTDDKLENDYSVHNINTYLFSSTHKQDMKIKKKKSIRRCMRTNKSNINFNQNLSKFTTDNMFIMFFPKKYLFFHNISIQKKGTLYYHHAVHMVDDLETDKIVVLVPQIF